MVDIEGCTECIYRAACANTSEPESPVHLARAILGPDAVRILPARAMPFSRAMLVQLEGRHRIFVSSAVPARELPHHVGHELGHWALQRAGFTGTHEAKEQAADAIGTAVVAPRRAFLRAMLEFGPDLHDPGVRATYAEAFSTTEALVTLRFGEVSRHPVALVHDGPAPLTRATPASAWPAPRVLAGWAAVPPPGVKKARLMDEPRWALFQGGGQLTG